MKKILSILVVITFLALLAVPASAKTCGNIRHRHGNYRHTHYSCIDGHTGSPIDRFVCSA